MELGITVYGYLTDLENDANRGIAEPNSQNI